MNARFPKWSVSGLATLALATAAALTTQSVSTRPAHAFMRPGTGARGPCPPAMARVPDGQFTLGESKQPATVAAFCLDVHEVTVADYRACTARKACKADGLDSTKYSPCNFGRSDREDHPINCPSWYQADAYCRAVGKRLPTEQEWEWAARAGARAWTYAFGNDAGDGDGWCWQQSAKRRARWPESTCSVMQYPPNPFGVYDLSGGVWEWTSTANPQGSSLTKVDEPSYVFRGGSWGSSDVYQGRVDVRGGDGASWQDPDVGFRCAADAR